jgi:hypothetical protein
MRLMCFRAPLAEDFGTAPPMASHEAVPKRHFGNSFMHEAPCEAEELEILASPASPLLSIHEKNRKKPFR